MDNIISWDNADWEIMENVYDPELGVWFEQWAQHSNLTQYTNS
jgi:hypothetical protein